MKPLMKDPFERSRNLPLVSVVFFGAFYLFLWLYIKPQLVYHYFEISRKAPFFKTGWLYLQDYLSYPSGPSQYLAAFLTQLCYFSWLGALCITLIAWAIYRLTVSLTAVAVDSPWRVVCYVPALLILMICGRYESPMNTAVVVLVVGLFSVLYEKASPRLGPARAILFLIISCFLYYFAGIAALIFVALASLCEFFHRGKVLFGVFYLLLGTAVCWLLGTYIFESAPGEIYLYSSPFIPTRQNEDKERWARIFEGFLFVALPVAVLLVGLGRRLAETGETSYPSELCSQEESSDAEETSGNVWGGGLMWAIQILLLVLVVVPSVLFSFDRKAKGVVEVSYFACRKMWPEVLTTARKSPVKRYFPFCNHAVNRALYHTGRFGDEMFAYPQAYRAADLVFCLIQGGNVVYMERAETCLELGLVNVAEKIAYEFMEGSDDSPFILKQLALINIVKGRIETARVFLRSLSRNLIYGREAKELLERLESDPQLERDEHIRYLRSVMMTTDIAYNAYNEDEWLTELLRRNRYNKMAFEYLMANYLLTRRLDKFVENLHRLDDFGYESIPRHYQEAVLLYIGTTRKNVDLGDRSIEVETLRQYNEINEVGKQFKHNEQALGQVLAPRFSQTYFFYFAFGASGMTSQSPATMNRMTGPPESGPIIPPQP